MQMDRYYLQAEKELQNYNYAAALRILDQIVQFATEHDLVLVDRFWFRHAEVALEAGSYEEAVRSVMRYLELTGREGEHYMASLEMLNEAESRVEEAKRRAAETERWAAEAERLAGERRAAEAERLAGERRAAEKRADEVAGVVAGMEFVRVPPGEFWMGSLSSEGYDDEHPVTRVRITEEFWLGKYEVTQEEWEAVMGSNPSHSPDCARCPVEDVSWEEVQEFLQQVNAQGDSSYRLPTEAEWEYAARAGTTGDRYGDLDDIAWWRGNSQRRTHPVGQKLPNGFGLHDILGNVSEFVGDWYGDYPGAVLTEPLTDPRGPRSGPFRVNRGGGWKNRAEFVRAPSRNSDASDQSDNLGFRLLRTR